MLVRLMDLKVHEWKPAMLDKFEKVLDAELKHSDEKKGTACKSIDFEQEAGYPKQDSRFLDLSIRGLCTDDYGKVHDIDKGLITVAIERHMDEVNEAAAATVYRVGNVQLFKRNRNKLNFIIIPISVGIVILLIVLTFVLRKIRDAQKRRHIVTELKKKRETDSKKAQTIANVDPHANEKQRLLQLDPTVVGSASDTLGSPKDFTNEKQSSQSRNNPFGGDNSNRGGSPTKDNRSTFNNQRSSRERMQGPYEQSDTMPMDERQPRVVVKTIRDDGNHPSYYQQHDDPSTSFVPIPVQVERSGPHQRNVAPPYHSDPYYRHVNS
ncbi:unnamed protein product [Adineta steineri]|uniref:Uncharacterized protein n=1 Tax=Adineta steineri TaxID=433720 RepID=A0A818XLP6_9BILA|nr:unnamed protein product [Adineta steineri]CAF3740937.1 unnamed protein product [Adineta steineri]